MQVTLMDLPYSMDALEPYYNKEVIELHYGRHHRAYTKKLNLALEQLPNENRSIEEILMDLDSIPSSLRTAITNNGGGFYNHNIFWKSMSAEHDQVLEESPLKRAIEKKFDNLENCIAAIVDTGQTVFGSGWSHLVTDTHGNVQVIPTRDQITPLAQNLFPLLSLDVWEHAYYPQYLNVRAEYISAFWHIVNWKGALERYNTATKQS